MSSVNWKPCPAFLFKIERKRLDQTLKYIAVETKMSESYYSKVENGSIKPSVDSIHALLNAYQISVDQAYKLNVNLEEISQQLSAIQTGQFSHRQCLKWLDAHQNSFYLLYFYVLESCTDLLSHYNYFSFIDHFRKIEPFVSFLPEYLYSLLYACGLLAFALAKDRVHYDQCQQVYQQLETANEPEIIALAQLYYDLNFEDYVAYLEHFPSALKQESSYWEHEILITKAIYANHMKNPQKAIQILNKILLFEQSNRYNDRINFIKECLGWMYIFIREYVHAIDYFESLDNLKQVFGQAYAYYRLGNPKKAIELLNRRSNSNQLHHLFTQWLKYMIKYPYGKTALSTLYRIEKKYAENLNWETRHFLYERLFEHLSHLHYEKEAILYLKKLIY